MINEFDKYKPKNTSIKFEDIQIGKMYAFTFNPKDGGNTPSKLLFRQDSCTLKQIKGHFATLSQCLKSAEIELATEASPSSARIHFHGTIIIRSFTDWLTELPMLIQFGTVCIKEIIVSDNENWFNYCYKQSHIWKPIFHNTNLAYPYRVPLPNLLQTPSNRLTEQED